MSRGSFARCLGPATEALEEAPDEVRAVVERLIAGSAAKRLEGLGEADALAGDPAALPFFLSLATHPDYPQASALLVRLSAALARADSPPRSRPTDAAAEMVTIHARHAGALLRVAQRSRDPESARAAARILGHLPEYDTALAPLLLALLSGAADAVERAPLLYFLARVQLAAGVPLHPRIERARSAAPAEPERVAVLLALEDAGVADSETTEALAALRATASPRLLDPRVWGRALS